jgi:hypothetical protein
MGNNALGIEGGAFPLYGDQQGHRVIQGTAVPVAAPNPHAPADLNGRTDSSDQRAAALDNLKSALFAQYGANASSGLQTPVYAYEQPSHAIQNNGLRSNQGHSARTSISSPLANIQNSANLGHDRDHISQSFSDLQLGRPQSGTSAQSPIGRAIDLGNGVQHQPTSPVNRAYGFAYPGSQGFSYNDSTRSPVIGDTTFAQQLSPLPGNGFSLALSNTSSIWAGTPAVPEAPRGTVACNGNFFNATTAFGRSGNINNRDDPTHFRNRLQGLVVGVGESVAAYDRAVLESALTDTTNSRSRPQ